MSAYKVVNKLNMTKLKKEKYLLILDKKTYIYIKFKYNVSLLP